MERKVAVMVRRGNAPGHTKEGDKRRKESMGKILEALAYNALRVEIDIEKEAQNTKKFSWK